MLKRISIDELKPGMFVHQVLEQTGALKIKSQGVIKTMKMIKTLRDKGILTLEIDLNRSILEESEAPAPSIELPDGPSKKSSVSDGEAMDKGVKLYQQAKTILSRFMRKVSTGQPATVSELQSISHGVVDALFENDNALSLLTLIKDTDAYVLEHALNSSILMAAFAKHMEIDSEIIEDLALAGLLMNVGMATVPEDIQGKKGSLSRQEKDVVNAHVDMGIEIVEECGDVNDTVLDVIANHHERLDGSGYPAGKSADGLSIYARMAAIVDIYDSLTSERPYRSAFTATSALKKLLADYSTQLDPALVQQFIRCLGVHPVGSLVKLKSGKLAIVIRKNESNPLAPRVMTFYSVSSSAFNETKQIDLSKANDEIEASVRPEEFKLNLNKFFKEVFLQSYQ